MFGSLLKLTKDLVTIVTAPVEIAIDLTGAVVKPIAEVAEEIVDDIKDITKE